jgi:hypothetical protein
MWKPRRVTTLRAFTACYWDSLRLYTFHVFKKLNKISLMVQLSLCTRVYSTIVARERLCQKRSSDRDATLEEMLDMSFPIRCGPY